MSPPRLRLQFAKDLHLFLRPRHRDAAPVQVPLDGTSTLGHVVEALGVPLPEVGRLDVGRRDGWVGVPSSYRPGQGELVHVRPVARPQTLPASPPCFLLDVHLGALARRLRLLGLDTAYRNDATDDELAEQATTEGRLLLTQDRGLLRRRVIHHAAYVRGARPDDQLIDVLDRFAPATAPFTRCTVCNARLAPACKADVLADLEPGTRRSYDEFARCPACGQVYWRGAHFLRLERLVARAIAAAERNAHLTADAAEGP